MKDVALVLAGSNKCIDNYLTFISYKRHHCPERTAERLLLITWFLKAEDNAQMFFYTELKTQIIQTFGYLDAKKMKEKNGPQFYANMFFFSDMESSQSFKEKRE